MSSPRAIQHQKIVDYLRKTYAEQLYQRGDVTYPMHIIPPDPDQIDDIDRLMGPLPQGSLQAEELIVYNHGYLQSLQNAGRNLFNGITFAYKRLRRRPLRLEASLGRYFDMIATCGALELELQDAIAQQGLVRLPLRSLYHREVDPLQALYDGRGRSAAIGGCTLTVFNHDGRYEAILARRSSKSALDAGFFHVLPAFIFQPMSEQFDPGEWRFSHHIKREYLEELFGMPEISAPYDHFKDHPALQDLNAMIEAGQASIHLTGICINLLTLRPEVCALLLIRDPDWYTRIQAPGSATPFDAQAETEDGRIHCVPIESDAAILAALPEDAHTHMPPQAAAALWLGADLARQKLGL